MDRHSLPILAGFASSTIFISSNLPMLFKAFKTKNLRSYSLGYLTLGALGKMIYIKWMFLYRFDLHGLFLG